MLDLWGLSITMLAESQHDGPGRSGSGCQWLLTEWTRKMASTPSRASTRTLTSGFIACQCQDLDMTAPRAN